MVHTHMQQQQRSLYTYKRQTTRDTSNMWPASVNTGLHTYSDIFAVFIYTLLLHGAEYFANEEELHHFCFLI